ncbi:MAG: Holliday junction resolvase RuvX [Pirellulaceae bacterium]
MNDTPSDPAFPARGRLAGIDYGTVRLGIAVTDPDRAIASPWATHTRRSEALDAAYFQQLVREERVVGFVIGLPVHLSGEESQKSLEARRFAQWLQQTTGLPVQLHDERFSTAEAALLLAGTGLTSRKRKPLRDQLAAQIILASYLEGHRAQRPQPLDDD